MDGSIWRYSSLRVNDDGYVEGSAYTREKAGHDVQVAVTSYEFERRGETMMNHVPNVTVTTKTGSIVAEPHAWDSQDAEAAMENAVKTAEDVFKDIQQYID